MSSSSPRRVGALVGPIAVAAFVLASCGGTDEAATRSTIDLSAAKGRAGLAVGGRVRIAGTGLYSGEIATIEKLVSGVIPQALVRTEAGKTRQVRTIDLEPVGPGASAQVDTPPASAAEA